MEHRGAVRSGELIGASVRNLAEENLGEIAEIVIDKNMGKVNYVVLDFGGFMSFGNKFFAVPWNLLTYSKDHDCFILNVEKEHFENAPGFDKDHWPNFASPEFVDSISDYYNGRGE